MRRIDMSRYQPFAQMGKTCQTRPIQEKRVVWPYVENYLCDGKFKGKIIGLEDIDKVAELWRSSYPELYGSSFTYEWVLYPEQYLGTVALKENWEEDSVSKKFCMAVIEEVKTGRFACGGLYTKDDRNLHIEVSLSCIHPDFRRGIDSLKLLSLEVLDYVKKLEEESGAEYMSAFCETWHDITQYGAFKRLGWKIAGIFPGQFTRWRGGNEEYRGCEVHFYRLLRDGEKHATKPEEWQLIPQARKLWAVLEEINKESDDLALRQHMKQVNRLEDVRQSALGKYIEHFKPSESEQVLGLGEHVEQSGAVDEPHP